MKNGMAAFLVAGLVCWAATAWADDPLPRDRPEEVGLSPARLARFATFAKAEIDAGQIPGAVVAVARRGKPVYFEAFGQSDKKAGTPMTTDTIFSAVWDAKSEGVRDTAPAVRQITIQDLMRHTSGLS